jgi:hypothetical protein
VFRGCFGGLGVGSSDGVGGELADEGGKRGHGLGREESNHPVPVTSRAIGSQKIDGNCTFPSARQRGSRSVVSRERVGHLCLPHFHNAVHTHGANTNPVVPLSVGIRGGFDRLWRAVRLAVWREDPRVTRPESTIL